ncbi:hypothetical protein WMW72_29850 [Paenibacillus filicis]|uniref:Uncharacterized protein n=1 Tax=Paenibacillus filicis TaxID=669464 RepID=A0ABU9DTB3_9BACL
MKLSQEESIHYPVLLFITMLSMSIARLQGVLLGSVGRNGIWVILSVWIVAQAGLWCCLQVGRRYGSLLLISGPDLTALQRLLFFFYALFFLNVCSFMNQVFGDFISKMLLNGSSAFYISVETVLATASAMFSLKTLARYAHILLLFAVPFFLALSFSPILNFRVDRLLPLWSMEEILQPYQAIGAAFLAFSPLAAIPLIHAGRKQVSGKSVMLLSFLVVALIVFILMAGIATYGIQRAREFVYLPYGTMNAVRIENFVFERIVFLWVLYWKYIESLGTAFMLRCGARCMAGLFGRRIGPLWVIAAGALVLLGGRLTARPILFDLYGVAIGYYSLVLVLILPILLYLRMKWKERTPA